MSIILLDPSYTSTLVPWELACYLIQLVLQKGVVILLRPCSLHRKLISVFSGIKSSISLTIYSYIITYFHMFIQSDIMNKLYQHWDLPHLPCKLVLVILLYIMLFLISEESRIMLHNQIYRNMIIISNSRFPIHSNVFFSSRNAFIIYWWCCYNHC